MTPHARDPVAGPGDLALRSEFGWAVVSLDTRGNGPRLRIFSPRSGRTILLDPFEVESLTQWRHDELAGLVLGKAYALDADLTEGAVGPGGGGCS
jgi:hypothetical protein